MPEKGTKLSVNLSLAELIKVTEEFQDVSSAAAGEREGRAVVAKILPESVPVSAFLVLVAAEGRRRGGGGARR